MAENCLTVDGRQMVWAWSMHVLWQALHGRKNDFLSFGLTQEQFTYTACFLLAPSFFLSVSLPWAVGERKPQGGGGAIHFQHVFLVLPSVRTSSFKWPRKGTCHQAWLSKFHLCDPHGRRRESILVSCPLTSTISSMTCLYTYMHMCVRTCKHTYTQLNKFNSADNREILVKTKCFCIKWLAELMALVAVWVGQPRH